MLCEYVLHDQCPKGHKRSWECHRPPPKVCIKCEEDAKRRQDEQQRALKMQEKRDRDAKDHLARMSKLDDMLESERQRTKDAQASRERTAAIRQKEQDLEKIRALADESDCLPAQPQMQAAPISAADRSIHAQTSTHPISNNPLLAPDLAKPKAHERQTRRESSAKEEWENQKRLDNASNDAIDSVMDMVGLEEVKLQILRIKAKIDACVRQNSDMKDDRLNVAFLGNPGTGMNALSLITRAF